jgi:hypothetical protein
MAWAADSRPPAPRHRCRERPFRDCLRSPPLLAAVTSHDQRLARAAKPGVVMRIPVDAECGEVDGVVGVQFRIPSRPSAESRRRLFDGGLEMEAAAADEGYRFAQSGGNGREKLFVSMARHQRIPSPMRGYEGEPATRSVTSDGKRPAWQHATPATRDAARQSRRVAVQYRQSPGITTRATARPASGFRACGPCGRSASPGTAVGIFHK